MDDYYSKYAKPINPFCYDNAIAKLKEWHSGMKEELEMFIFKIGRASCRERV